MENDILRKYMEGALSPQEKAGLIAPPLPADASELLVSVSPQHYSASQIARAVEDCNAQLLGLSVTAMRDDRGWPVVALRVNLRDASAVVRSLGRFGYEPFYVSNLSSDSVDIARERVNELLHILDL